MVNFILILVLIHMDLKPQNMVFVKEKSGEKILKVIDFAGSEFFQQNQSNDPNSSNKDNKKMASTLYIMPPEMDWRYYNCLHENENENNFNVRIFYKLICKII